MNTDSAKTNSFCTYFNAHQCRSCTWIAMEGPFQIAKKETILRNALAFLPELHIETSVRSPQRGFRNKAKMSVTGSVDHPIIGILGTESLDLGQALLSCPIHHPRLNELFAILPEFIRSYALTPYQIQKKSGELKGIIAFYSPQTEQMYLRFILRSRECISRIRKLLGELQSRMPDLVCISANIQPIPHAVLEGPEEIFLTERKSIDHVIGSIPINPGLKSGVLECRDGVRTPSIGPEGSHPALKGEVSLSSMKLNPQAFVQTNVQVATALYQTAAQWIAEVHPSKVLELYCGQGAFSFFSQASADEFLGIEINPEAVIAANETAKELGFSHVHFKCSDAAQIKEDMEVFHPDLILVNPPRRGLAQSLPWIQNDHPPHLLYSSCNIKTLAIDLKALSKDYTVKRVQLFDMFPHTEHFETLVWLKSRKKSDYDLP